MKFEIDGPFDAEESDVIEIADEIRREDLVWFDRAQPQKLVLRLVMDSVDAVCYRVDPTSNAESMKLIAEDQILKKKIWRYFDPVWRSQSFGCFHCEWAGGAISMDNEVFDDLMDFKCPKCRNIILIISFPTIAETRRAASRGNAEAIAELEKFNEH